jgi:hypothetical protein
MWQYLLVLVYANLICATQSRHNIIFKTPHTFGGARVAIINTNDNQNRHEILQINSMRTDTTLSPACCDTAKPLQQNLSWWQKITENKSTTFLGVAALSMCCGITFLLWAEYQLNHAQAWACWQPAATASVTTAVSEQLAPALFTEIKNRYYKQGQTVLHVIDPIIAFMQACDKELWLADWIITLRGYCSRLSMIAGVMNNETALHNALDKQKRLQFLKQVMVMHLSEYTPDERLLGV